MDLDIVFASNLVVEFKVNIWVTNNNCEILCFQVKGIPAKISDFGFRGMLRVVFKPLVSSCLKKFSCFAICLLSGQPDTIGWWDPSLLLEGSLWK